MEKDAKDIKEAEDRSRRGLFVGHGLYWGLRNKRFQMREWKACEGKKEKERITQRRSVRRVGAETSSGIGEHDADD